jgi:hypothetical protein
MTIPAVEKKVRVQLAAEDAFDLFTRQVARWWPLARHSCGGVDAVEVAFDPRVGGHVIERTRDGTQHVWGTVTVWEPPLRFAMTWHPARKPEEATRLSVEFVPTQDGATEVRLVHDGWNARDADARESYNGGWETVLARFVAAAAE